MQLATVALPAPAVAQTPAGPALKPTATISTPDVISTIPWLLACGVLVSVIAGFFAMVRFLEV